MMSRYLTIKLIRDLFLCLQVEQVVLVDQERLSHFSLKMMPQIYAGVQ